MSSFTLRDAAVLLGILVLAAVYGAVKAERNGGGNQ